MRKQCRYKRIAGGAQAVPGQRPQGFTSMGDNGQLQRRTGFGGYGYEDPTTKQWVPFGVDAINGGGAGMAGNRFKGPFAITGLLNMLGVRPQGYDPNAPVQPQADGQAQPRDNSAMVNMLNSSDALISRTANRIMGISNSNGHPVTLIPDTQRRIHSPRPDHPDSLGRK
jgi:hypothetical protein